MANAPEFDPTLVGLGRALMVLHSGHAEDKGMESSSAPPEQERISEKELKEITTRLQKAADSTPPTFMSVRFPTPNQREDLYFWVVLYSRGWIATCVAVGTWNFLSDKPCATRKEAMERAEVWSKVNMDDGYRDADNELLAPPPKYRM